MDPDARLRAYASAHHLSLTAARAHLITIALDHLDERSAGGKARWKGSTKATRSAAAKRAVAARWAKATD